MKEKDQQDLIWLHGQAVERAQETGERQRIVWLRWPGYLNPCSTDFEDGFCCGDRPYTGFALPLGPPRRVEPA